MAVSKYREVHFFLMLLVSFFGSVFGEKILTQCLKLPVQTSYTKLKNEKSV